MIAPLILAACAGGEAPGPALRAPSGGDTAARDDTADTGGDTADTGGDTADTGEDTAPEPVVYDPWPFAEAVASYAFGEAAGFGQDRFPDVVFGPPEAPGDGGGSLDVVSLGREGFVVLSFRDIDVVDGPGPDLLVFENPFAGFAETGIVGVSEDGETWTEWTCDTTDAAGGHPGCAGVAIVYANSTNGVDATEPDAAGGDRFDLAEIGVARARFVRVRDSGANGYAGTSGGFDLDAVAIVNAAAR